MKTSKEMTDIVFTKMAAYESKMKKRKKLIIKSVSIISVFLVAILTLTLFIFNSPTKTHQINKFGDLVNSPDLSTKNPDLEIYIDLGDDVSYTLDEMIEKSDLIIRASLNYVKVRNDEVFNGYYDFVSTEHTNNEPFATSEEVKYKHTSGMLAELIIKDVLKGEAENEIEMSVEYCDFYSYFGYEFIVENPFNFTEESQTNEYILFLNKDEKSNLYTPATSPCAYSIIDGKINLHSGLKNESLRTQYRDLREIVSEEGRKNSGYIIKINLIYPVVEDKYSKTDVNEFINLIKRKVDE